MSRRRAANGGIEPVSGQEALEDSETESAFDAAQDLLAAALDEVRVSQVDHGPPAAPEASAGVRTATPRPSRRRSGATEPAPIATPASETTAAPAPRARRARKRPARTKTEPDASPIRALEEQAEAIRQRTQLPDRDLALAAPIEELEEDDEDELDLSPSEPGPSDDATIPDVPQIAPAPSSTGTPAYDPAPLPASREHRGAHSRGAVWLAVIGVAAVALIVGAIIASSSGNGGSDEAGKPAGRAAPAPRVAFDRVTTPEGAVVERVWTLQGPKGGRFVGTLSFSNPTSAPLEVAYTEVIPKSLARSVDDIRFDPQPTVLEADPVFQFHVTVPVDGNATARYEIAVAAAGARRARLVEWADAADRASQQTSTTTTAPSTTTTLAPATTAAPPTTVLALPGPPPPPPPPPPSTGTGAIVVRAVSQGAGGTFRYSGPGGSAALTTSGSGSAQSATIPVSAGVVSWTQVAAPPGSTLLGVSCSGGASVSGATATFEVHPGETVACTWTNG